MRLAEFSRTDQRIIARQRQVFAAVDDADQLAEAVLIRDTLSMCKEMIATKDSVWNIELWPSSFHGQHFLDEFLIQHCLLQSEYARLIESMKIFRPIRLGAECEHDGLYTHLVAKLNEWIKANHKRLKLQMALGEQLSLF